MTTGDRKRNYPFAPKVTSQTVVAESAEGVAEAINETEASSVPAEDAPVAVEGAPHSGSVGAPADPDAPEPPPPNEPDAEPAEEGDEG